MSRTLRLLVLLGSILVASPAAAQSMQTVSIHLTRGILVHQDNCFDVQNSFVQVTGPSGQLVTMDPDFALTDGQGSTCTAWAGAPSDITSQGFILPASVLACETEALFRVQGMEEDGFFGNPHDLLVDCTINALDGQTEHCCSFNNNFLCFDVIVQPPPPPVDSDGDGLSDADETFGRDIDCDGAVMTPGVDLFLPQMGANPAHKDIFVEMNWFSEFVLDAAELNALKFAFANAPPSAGGSLNPDGIPGINVHIDAGAVMNDLGTFGEGGVDLGPASGAPVDRDGTIALMDTLESDNRVGVFRQLIFFDSIVPDAGGGTIGEDRIQLERRDGGGMMHELGHLMGLQHGGEAAASLAPGSPVRERVGRNCKPNHLSVMNYLYSDGIPIEVDGFRHRFIDFAPAKIPENLLPIVPGCADSYCNPRLPLGVVLNEGALDETSAWFTTDIPGGFIPRHLLYYFTYSPTRTVTSMETGSTWLPTNWNDDAYDFFDNTTPPITTAAVNINYDPSDGMGQGCGHVPMPENNLMTPEVLDTLDEWSVIDLRLQRGLLSSPVNPIVIQDRLPDYNATETAMRTTDLSVAASLSPTPIVVGQPATLQVDVANVGRNPAFGGRVGVFVPTGLSFQTLPAGCVQVDASTAECSLAVQQGPRLEALRPGQVRAFQFTLNVTQATAVGATILVGSSHDGDDEYPPDNVDVIPVSVMPAFLSFDDLARPWIIAWSGGTPITTTTNANTAPRAASFNCGFTQVETPTFSTHEFGVTGTTLVMDVWVPAAQNPNHVGEVQLFVDIPAAGLWNLSVGQRSFNTLPRNVWTPVSFSLPANVVTALRGSHPNARFRMSTSVATCGAPVRIDSLRFGGQITVRTVPHVPGGTAVVTSSSVLTFDDIDDWQAAVGTIGSESVLKTEGDASVALLSSGYTELVSRPFDTFELEDVNARLSFDVRIPDLPAGYSWVGDMNVFIDCPSINLHHLFVGHKALQILFEAEFNRVEFPLAPAVVAALGGAADECSFTVGVASNQTIGPLVIDRGGFVQ